MFQKPNGIFHLEWLMDNPTAPIPSITLTNCEFQYFLGSKYAKSLISFEKAG
jgi:hypothetical protein